jgi:hypothetical protein
MQLSTSLHFAVACADEMISARFGRSYGIHTFARYLDEVDRRATAHLDDRLARRIRDTAGAQRRKARLRIENAGTVIVAVPMNDPRTGATIWAEVDLATWLNLIEMGADGAWFFANKGQDRGPGQVRTTAPLASDLSNKNVTVARLIVNAKPGQQARVLDRNPLNLRAGNVFLVGNPATCEGRIGGARTDTRRLLQGQVETRRALAGGGYGIPVEGGAQ